MKAVKINNYGQSDVFQFSDVETLKPNKDLVLIEVRSASINPFDIATSTGKYKDNIPLKLPYTPGGDFSGVITEISKDFKNFNIGDEVFGGANVLSGGTGSMAEYALVNSENICLKPKNISFEEAAASVLVGVSAVQALEENIELKKNQKILIHGGAGGIGHIAIQMATAIGAQVATTVSTDDVEFAKKLAEIDVIDYKKQDFENILKDFDAVYDTVGGETTNKSFCVLKKGGILVSMLGEPDQKIAKDYGVKTIGQNTKITSERLKRLSLYLAEGKVKVNIDKVYPLQNIKDAIDYFMNSSPRGKVVIKVK